MSEVLLLIAKMRKFIILSDNIIVPMFLEDSVKSVIDHAFFMSLLLSCGLVVIIIIALISQMLF